jgi:hypothetical protein
MLQPSADVTVVIPAHSARMRNGMVKRAVGSALLQTLMPTAVIVEIDHRGEGAAVTRDRALRKVTTEWVAYLDSDDQFKANHLQVLYDCAMRTGADVTYSWYEAVGFGRDPLPHFGKPFDPLNPTQTTITVLERTALAQQVGFRIPPEGALINGERYGEDFQHTVEMIQAGARIVHEPVRSWIWNCHGLNTSGMPGRGDAALPTGATP